MINTKTLHSLPFRTALLRRYIAEAFLELMIKVNGEPVYVEDGERIPLTPDRVAINIIYHIESPLIDSFGIDEGSYFAAKALEKMLIPGFMGESIRLSITGVTEMREVYRDIIFGAPDGQLPEGMELMQAVGGEDLL
ncbi:hypothetical protein M2371_000179 [Buttiauxella sp. BIGb0471]|uniref:hypothetical protein n=1 Tax=Buttiauxella sp. BIGb0471 TaxID=2940597 RepID=UPI002166F01E|nr:hypothetical protein [Buttiauxella sp. BIGb0471]MCS3600993.1 hypothetical protein [Buttiauxella sp. BIGb0471]